MQPLSLQIHQYALVSQQGHEDEGTTAHGSCSDCDNPRPTPDTTTAGAASEVGAATEGGPTCTKHACPACERQRRFREVHKQKLCCLSLFFATAMLSVVCGTAVLAVKAAHG